MRRNNRVNKWCSYGLHSACDGYVVYRLPYGGYVKFICRCECHAQQVIEV